MRLGVEGVKHWWTDATSWEQCNEKEKDCADVTVAMHLSTAEWVCYEVEGFCDDYGYLTWVLSKVFGNRRVYLAEQLLPQDKSRVSNDIPIFITCNTIFYSKLS